ncbi:cupin domain-containing protein [Komagataeibacter oboediens]|uniref:Cupin n=1 Tax=Komagataeibacter oboediens TaxID=65958 RepID=A0A318QV48_9PROT|nr:cupin domain-containing protein [Komagataeibacter oboediens]GBR36091.1 cupin superfamily protein [Komagataeibacter oboediens DSM 11826]MBL7234029.1 cupin domain-containing protein [Komagataeibacter oboediens]MBT0674014.1 cupin domain-containing protein [Komagataeibacter oboediens]MBT0677264.1 cupin domain-containing protein [Komagataeibacter oboediens]PYD83446.1 cupin [Komagataeibacter oboediens]
MIDLRDPSTPPESVRQALGLQPHPEGGSYREIWRDTPADGPRGAVSTIMFLLAAGERSHWHRVDAAEIWCWQGGSPLVLEIAPRADGPIERVTIGPLPEQGQVMQAVVPAGAWQAAFPEGAWSLTGCQVAPAFVFSSFELAPPGWSPQGEAE